MFTYTYHMFIYSIQYIIYDIYIYIILLQIYPSKTTRLESQESVIRVPPPQKVLLGESQLLGKEASLLNPGKQKKQHGKPY